MDEVMAVTDILTQQPMPKLAEALRERKERILARWDQLVRGTLPDADTLTSKEVRNSIPKILEQIALALEADNSKPTEKLLEITKVHGVVRFHESYNIEELMVEYRILRRVLVEEMDAAFEGVVSVREWSALDVAVDISQQQAVTAFLEHQKMQITAVTESEAKFLSFIAHDLRNGLNTIMLSMLWAERSIKAYPELAEQVESLMSARGAVTETMGTMERMLQAERLRKDVAVAKKPVGLKKVADEVAGQYKGVATEKGIGLEVAVPAEAVAESDAGLLGVILQNLVGNAIKYSEKGVVRIVAAPKQKGWELEVWDEGKGIAPEKMARLFDAFSRGETHGQTGVGLGLYIAAQAARNLGVKIGVESTVGKGSRFSVVLA